MAISSLVSIKFVSIKAGGDEMKIRNTKKKSASLRGASVSEAFAYRGQESYVNSCVNAKTW